MSKKINHKNKSIKVKNKTLILGIPLPNWMVKDKFKDED